MKKHKYKLFIVLLTWIYLLRSTSINAQNLLIDEQFDAQIPTAFSLYNDTNTPHLVVSEYTNAWIFKEDPSDPSNGTASSTSYFLPRQMAHRWLVTPQIVLGNSANVLYWKGKSHDESYAESYLVLLSTTNSERESFTDTIAIVYNETTEWTSHAVNLSEKGYNAQNVYIAFVLVTVDGFKFYLDALKITAETPTDQIPDTDSTSTLLPPPLDPILKIQDNLGHNSVKLYPNPTNHTLTIKSEMEFDKIVIRNTIGQTVIETRQPTINVQALLSGVYFVEINSKNGIITRNFVKY